VTLAPRRILIVEDQKIVATDLESAVTSLGYTVVGTASSAEEAIEKAGTLGADLVLMDIRLRGERDGIWAAKIIRERFDRPIVFLTAYADEETISRARSTAPFGYVVKPFNERELHAAIEMALYKQEADRESEGVRARLAEAETRRRTSEEEQRRFRSLIESIRDYAILMLDPHGRILTWSHGAEAIKGYRTEEIVGQHFSRFYPEEDIASGKPERELKLATDLGRFEDEGWRVRKDGSRFWANVVITPIFDLVGHMQGFAKVTRDLTERKRAEDALREADRRKSEFLAVLSHELRNPLAPICHSLYLLDHAEAGSEQAGHARAVLRRQTDHLTRLVDDLLDVTRISRGTINVQKTRLDLVELVRRTVEDHSMLFSARGVALDLHLGELPLWIDADATRIAQAIGNLLSNAAKFSNASGRVVIAAERGAGGMALVRVKDDGGGIEVGLLPRIFEPFIQADRSLDRSLGGLGLGLSLVKGFVELHGGWVEARSDGPGRGAEFIIRLWLAPEQPVLRDAGRPSRDRTAPRRVLIIEDNVDAAEALRDVLEMWQHEAEVAHDGRTGMEKARAFRPDIILCDIGLPEMDGYEVARAIRSDPTLASVFLVAVTGYATPGDQRKAANAGFNRHLGKPVSVEAIREVVATAPKAGLSAAE
jgi:PAS domain S-box-containing protein